MTAPTYATIANGCNRSIKLINGTIPDVSGAIRDWFQPMVFEIVCKTVVAFSAGEVQTPICFRGMMQPFTERQLQLKPEGQRAWDWFWVHTDAVLPLKVDDVVVYLGKHYRCMTVKDYLLNGYMEYQLREDWTGSDPVSTVCPPPETVYDGGSSSTPSWSENLDGGSSDIVGPIADGGDSDNPTCPEVPCGPC